MLCINFPCLQVSGKNPNSKNVKIKLTLAGLLLLLVGLSFVTYHYYSFIFARHVKGEVVGIDRVTQPNTIIGSGGQIPASQVFSFAIAVRDSSGEIVTASSEDRQWAVVEKGQCAEAKYFPYPFWQLDKSGTYFGARLLKLYDCEKK
jgi:hypothetical protein